MAATSDKSLGIVNDPTAGEQFEELVVSNRVIAQGYLASIRDNVARNTLLAALFSVAGPREAEARGYLTESADLSGGANTFSISSNDTGRYDGAGYLAGICPKRASSANLEEQTAGIFSIEHNDAQLKTIPFSSTAATTYYVGITVATYPTISENLPRIGSHRYTQEKTVLGLKVKPTLVTDLGGGQIKLAFPADTLVGNHSLAGRTAVVYLNGNPVATTATAIESGTITFSTGVNSVTVGYLGQAAPSTTPADYTAVILGPICTNDPTVLDTDGYAHIGTIVGATYVVDTDSQDFIPTMLGLLRDVLEASPPSNNTPGTNAMKIFVKAKVGESAVTQIGVKNAAGTQVFAVYEDGSARTPSLKRVADWDRDLKFSTLDNYAKWSIMGSAASGGTFNNASLFRVISVAGNVNGTVTFRSVLKLSDGDQILGVGMRGEMSPGATMRISLDSWDMDTVLPVTVGTHFFVTTGSEAKEGTTFGSPVVFSEDGNERYILEGYLQNNGAALDTAKLVYMYAVIRRAADANVMRELHTGG